jgi:hypothetical protein
MGDKETQAKIGGIPIEAVIEPHPHNRRRPSVMVTAPEIAAQWYYKKNCGFGPEDFSYGSQVNAWWQCPINPGHIWRARVLTRCVQKRGCPYCFGNNRIGDDRVAEERSLQYCFPRIAEEWHAKRNRGLTPRGILWGSNKKVWWQCRQKQTHVWQASVKQRTSQRVGCPDCYADRMLDLRKFPDALKLFDKRKNKGVNPYRTTTTTYIWWRCPRGEDHTWFKPFRKKKLNCPFCSWRQPSVTNNLERLFPNLAAELHPTKNGALLASQIPARSCRYVWWKCSTNPRHVWYTIVRNRTMNHSGCPQCWRIRRPQYFVELATKR